MRNYGAVLAPPERLENFGFDLPGWRCGLRLEGNLLRSRGRFGGPSWLGAELMRVDESLAETSRRRLGAISPAPYRLVGTFSFARAIPISWLVSGTVSGPFRGTWRRLTGYVGSIDYRRRPAAIVTVAATSSAAAGLAITFAFASTVARGCIEVELLAEMAIKVLWLDIGNMEEAVAANREIDKGGLNSRLEVDDFALIDVTGVTLVAGSFDVQLLEDAILDDGDAAFLGLEHIDEHFFLHAGSFRDLRRRMGADGCS
jgi:hypothetical protein